MGPLSYKLVDKNRKGLLQATVCFDTDIRGHRGETDYCCLMADGRLYVQAGYVWDFGSGAIDTPAMVRASLAHDALCDLTNARAVPWSVRKQADKLFRKLLKKYSPGGPISFLSRWWRWGAVSIYSQGIARWKDRH